MAWAAVSCPPAHRANRLRDRHQRRGGRLPPPTEPPISGPTFLGTEPYGAGVAPIAVRSDRDGAVRLHLAFPAEVRTAELRLDEDGRIVEETLTDPKHVILRRFIYPDHAD